MKTTTIQTLTAYGLAVIIHIGLVTLLWSGSAQRGNEAPGNHGVSVSLGTLVGEPGSLESTEEEVTEDASVREMQQIPDVVEAVSDHIPDNVEVAEIAEMVPEQPAEVIEAIVETPEPQVETIEQQDSVPSPEIASRLPEVQASDESPVDQIVTVEPESESPPAPVSVDEVTETAVSEFSDSMESIEPVPMVEATETVSEQRDDGPQTVADTASLQQEGGQNGAAGNIDEQTSEAGTQGDMQSYMVVVRDWLERHKRYPLKAKRRKQEGVVKLWFKVDTTGRVVNFRVEESSGYATLDDEVVRMLKRAEPLPLPDESWTDSLVMIVPINFSLR